MKIFGGIYFDERGLSTSIRGMHMQTELLNTISQNLMGFDKPGYQKQENVVSSFAQYVGVHGLSRVKDDSVGRLGMTMKPLDFALSKEGFFQYLTPEGIKQTRDGRFKLDKDGYLLTNENYKVLARDGAPIKFNTIPDDLGKIKVNTQGEISVYDDKTGEMTKVAALSVVNKEGMISDEADVRQGYIEYSNVRMEEEAFAVAPIKNNFLANRQMFVTQNTMLTKTIQNLSQSS